MILAGLAPTAAEVAELHAAGWSLILTSGKKMGAVKDGEMIPWDLALHQVRFPP